jgi:ABC-2 type transport system permease protein
MILWGFITTFFVQNSSWVAQATGVLISAVLLWDVLFRANLGVALSFTEEMWARNLGQLFVSPLRPIELALAVTFMGFIRTVIAVTPAALLALPFFNVWVFAMGPPIAAFFASLIVFGWSLGLIVSALVLRFGLGAESLAWVAVFAIAPISGIYYPISSLPPWLQPLAWALPPAWVFEGMRAALVDHHFRLELLVTAAALNAVYLAVAIVVFLSMIRVARERGLLLQQGE